MITTRTFQTSTCMYAVTLITMTGKVSAEVQTITLDDQRSTFMEAVYRGTVNDQGKFSRALMAALEGKGDGIPETFRASPKWDVLPSAGPGSWHDDFEPDSGMIENCY